MKDCTRLQKQPGWYSGETVDLYSDCAGVGILIRTPTIHTEFFMVFLSPSDKFRRSTYLDYAMTAFFQILYNSAFILPFHAI
jgi:hypothetical protein